MINFGFDNDNIGEPLEEKFIDDVIKSTANVDTKKVKDIWTDAANANKRVVNKVSETENETLGNIADTLDDYNKKARNSSVDNRSIIARARNSVLQFPIYITQTIRVNEAHIIAKLFERVYTTLVQTVLAQNKIVNEDEANDLVFLKNFHSNLKEAADVLTNKYYEPIDDIDAMMCESIFYSQKLTENCTVEFSVVPPTNKDLLLENTRLLNEPLSGFVYLREADETINSRETVNSSKYATLNDSDLKDIACDRYKIDRNTRRQADMSESDVVNSVKAEYAGKSKDEIDDAVSDAIYAHKEYQAQVDDAVNKLKEDIKNKKVDGLEYKNGKYCRKDPSVSIKRIEDGKPINAPTLLRDADIKKINGMLPYTIEATFRIKQKNGNLTNDVRYIIGIKSVLHLIRAQDLADDLDEIIIGNIKTLQKVRYKTGEISFKDYFLNIKGIKADAMKHVNYNKRWLNTLKRLAEYNKLNGSLLKGPAETLINGKVPIPNGTLILSQLDVNNMVNQTGIDISDVSIAKKLAKSLFLIGVVIVDSTAGSMRVLFPDSDVDWDVQSLSAIDSELSKTDNSSLMRELNKMVNR